MRITHLLSLQFTLFALSPVHADFRTGQSADLMLGVPARPVVQPVDVAIDPLTQKVFVCDTGGSRVLRYDSLAAMQNDALPEAYIGQPDQYSMVRRTSQTGLSSPRGITVDAGGRLWVVDTGNIRVLRWDSAATRPAGAFANAVLGQATFSTATAGTTASTFNQPYGLALEHSGTTLVQLWVADLNYERGLAFNSPVSKPNGGAADGVLGQPDLTSTAFGGGWHGLFAPTCPILEPGGTRLWVVDSFNVKRYSPALESQITGYGFNSQNRFFLGIPGRGGETYQIRSSTDLLNWNTIERTDTIPGTGTQIMSWTAAASPTGPKKFYRLQLQ